MTLKKNYHEAMFDGISDILEKTGEGDPDYDNFQKATDILDVLEGLLAFAIYNTSISPETIRESCDESYLNIKERALAMFEKYGLDDNSEQA